MLLLVCGPPATGDVPAPQGRATANHPPVLMFNIPLQTFLEDNPGNMGYHLVNLSKYFADDGGVENLTYSIACETDQSHIHATVDGHFLSFTAPTQDWYGQERCRVRATDGEGMSTDSNNFTVRVAPVRHDITIDRLPEIELTAEKEWFFNLTDHILYMGNDPNPLGVVADSPYIRAEGLVLYLKYPRSLLNLTYNESVLLNVSDRAAHAEAVLNVTVHPNDRWRDLPPDPWEIAVTYGDVHLEYLSNIVPGNETPIRPLAWNITGIEPGDPPRFSAAIEDDGKLLVVRSLGGFGTGHFALTAQRATGWNYSCNVSIEILPVSLSPYVSTLQDVTVKEHDHVSFRLVENYPGGELAFRTNSTAFPLSSDGWVNFTADQNEVGRWRICYSVAVRDCESESRFGEFNLTVLNVNEPPVNAVILKPADRTRTVQGRTIELEGNASDPDGDALDFTWFCDGEAFGRGRALTAGELTPGTHRISLEVSDGEYSKAAPPVEVTVEPRPTVAGPSMPLTAMFLLFALALAVGGLLLLRRKRK